MKYVKMLGLAAVAAMALMAFLGASSASATVLCSNPETSGCKAPYTGAIEASLEGTASLETTGGTVVDTCTGGTVAGTPGAGNSTTTVSGAISTLTFTGCTRTTDVLANGSLEIHWISGTDNGTVTGSGSRVTINPPLGLGPCVYGTENGTHIGTLTGGTSPTLHIEAIVPLIVDEGSGFCPPDARWTGSYEVTNAAARPLYVSTS